MKILVFAVSIFISSVSVASGYDVITDTFFEKLKSDQPESAVDYLYDTNSWIDKGSDQVINLKAQLKGLRKLVGKYEFHELIVEENIGARYARLVYMVGYERQPLRFVITVYRPGGKWRFQGVSFDDHIDKPENK